MEANTPLQLAMKMNRISGHDIMNDSTTNKIISAVQLVMLGVMFALGVLGVMFNFHSLDSLPDYFELINNHYLFIANMLWFRAAIPSLKQLISTQGFWRIDHLGDKIKKDQQKIYKFVANAIKLIMISGLFLISLTFLGPLISKVRRLPLLCYHPVDLLQTPLYEFVYLWQFVNSVFMLIFLPSLTAMFYAAITFGYCQTMMLKEAVRNLDLETCSYNAQNEQEDLRFRQIKIYVEYHSKLLLYAKRINRTYSFILLNDFMVTVGNCVMPLYLIAVIGMSNTVVLAKCLLTIALNLSRLLLVCVAVTLYTTQSRSVSKAVYESRWVNAVSLRTRKAIVLMIQRAQLGQDFLAGGIVNVNMENYLAIIRLSFSFYTLMKSFQSE